MIMGSWVKHPVGSRQTGIINSELKIHKDQPFVVLREATYEEWVAQEELNLSEYTPDQLEMAKKGYFYEISID